jgi:transposase
MTSSTISSVNHSATPGCRQAGGPGERVGRLNAEQAEIARLTRENARMSKRLHTTEAAPGHHKKSTRSLGKTSKRACAFTMMSRAASVV